jgi:membrane-bound lytic murein transglycosylase D
MMKKLVTVLLGVLMFCNANALEFPKDTLQDRQVAALKKEEIDEIDRMLVASYLNHFCFSSDPNIQNAFNYDPDHVPSFPEELTRERLKILDRESPFDLVYNDNVRDFIALYSLRRRDVTSKVLGLAQLYFPLIEDALAKYNIPLELKYLAIVESALNPTAISRAGAAGLWQFMPGTGKMYGLDITSYQDERFDPIKETEAACKYLRFLYNTFGDWNLALAAYNSGPGNVNKAIRRAGGKKDFWAIKQFLPKETQGYVPAFIAVNYIMSYSTEHNIFPKKASVSYFETDTIHVTGRVDFNVVSKTLNLPIEEITYLNGTYKLKEIPDNGEKHYLMLPVEKIGDFLAHEKEIYAASDTRKPEPEPAPEPSDTASVKKEVEQTTKVVWEDQWKTHKVKKGETLKGVASKYGVSSSDVKKWNKLKSSSLKAGQNLKVKVKVKKTITIPKVTEESEPEKKPEPKVEDKPEKTTPPKSTTPKVTTPKADPPKAAAPKEEFIYYTVKAGDNLSSIASKHKVSVDSIIKLNKGLNANKIKSGQKLKIKKK